jgi:hypothetical protein
MQNQNEALQHAETQPKANKSHKTNQIRVSANNMANHLKQGQNPSTLTNKTRQRCTNQIRKPPAHSKSTSEKQWTRLI